MPTYVVGALTPSDTSYSAYAQQRHQVMFAHDITLLGLRFTATVAGTYLLKMDDVTVATQTVAAPGVVAFTGLTQAIPRGGHIFAIESSAASTVRCTTQAPVLNWRAGMQQSNWMESTSYWLAWEWTVDAPAIAYAAFSQLDTEDPDTIATTVAARTSGFDAWMGGEVQARGFTLGWTENLPWLLGKSGIDPATTPKAPHQGSCPTLTVGRIWPR